MTRTHHSHPSHPQAPPLPSFLYPLADALAQPLVFADPELSEGIQRHGLVGLLRAALSRQLWRSPGPRKRAIADAHLCRLAVATVPRFD
jgi:hypothetical protein